jgi:hypothetical protein
VYSEINFLFFFKLATSPYAIIVILVTFVLNIELIVSQSSSTNQDDFIDERELIYECNFDEGSCRGAQYQQSGNNATITFPNIGIIRSTPKLSISDVSSIGEFIS